MSQVDAVPGLADLVLSQPPPDAGQVPTEYAFLVWSKTDLAANRLTSAIELYAEGGGLTSRFALNLPEYTQAQQRWQEAGCDWEVFEEVSPFGSEERRLLHAGRGLCVDEGSGTRMVGTIVIHAMLDYGSLPFITSQNPYVELFQSRPSFDAESTLGRDVGFVVYGWSLHAHLCVEPDDLDDRRRDVPAGLRVAHAVLDEPGRRGPARPRLPGQRSRRHLRAGLPGHVRRRPPGGPRRTGHPGRRDLRAADAAALGGHRRRGHQGRAGPGPAPRDPRQLLPQAVPRVRRRRGHPGAHAGVRRPRLHDGPPPRRRRRGGHPHHDGRAAVRRGLHPHPGARRGRRDHHQRRCDRLDLACHRPGRERVRRPAPGGHQRARPVRVGPPADADGRGRLPRDRAGPAGDLRGRGAVRPVSLHGGRRPAEDRGPERPDHGAPHAAAAGHRPRESTT